MWIDHMNLKKDMDISEATPVTSMQYSFATQKLPFATFSCLYTTITCHLVDSSLW